MIEQKEELQVQEEEKANPYNMEKSWHKPDEPMETANSLFYNGSTKQATPDNEEAPVKEESEKKPRKRTNYKKRYDDLKKHYDDRVAQFKQREQQLMAEKRAAQPEYEAPRTEEQLEQFKKEYPDLYETVETVAHLQSERQVKDLQSQLSAVQQREADIMRREAEAGLKQSHPDFEDIRGSEEFHEWAKEQPDQIQDWIYKNAMDARLASKAIDLYKLEKKIETPIKQSRQSRQKQSTSEVSAADLVSTKTTTVDATRPQKVWTEREIAAMSMDEFDKFEQEINEAISEGRVVKQ
tara:strand:- start:3079 stop:3963 length:885 start_codon:yes stop_codon:yes gene_type:complete